MNLAELGWNPVFEAHFEPFERRGLSPARVVREERLTYEIRGEHESLTAVVSGKLRFEAASAADRPAVGDWVAVEPRPAEGRATIHAVLPRKSVFARRAAGSGGAQQVAAANIDHVFLISGLDGDFNPRRIERYLTVAWNSGAAPVVVLNKADLCPDPAARSAEIESVAPATPIHAISAATGYGMAALRTYVQCGRTVALLGSSGVGKSTLLNALLGTAAQRTETVRAGDDHGRHTTTRRELFLLPAGGMVIDTPGMRELQLWSNDNHGLSASFGEIEELSRGCRFRDCRHESEPGCAVRAALDEGTLAAERLAGFGKLQRELHHAAIRNDRSAQAAEKAKWKRIHKTLKKQNRNRARW